MHAKDFELTERLIRTWSTFVPEDTVDEVATVLRSKWINTGTKEQELREQFSRMFDIPYCVACNSGTSALRASLAMLGVGPGDEVVSTAFTFLATNTAILEQGARPVFADIDYGTLNIDPQSIADRITPKTRALMCVHYAGNACDMDAIRAIGRAHDLPVIEDSAHAMGAKYKGKYIGSDSDIATFSLQVVKIVTAGDGGLMTTTNERYYKLLKQYVWFGIDRELKTNNLIDPLPDSIDVLGFKYNMNDISAAVGVAGLRHFAVPFKRRQTIGSLYRREFAACRKIALQVYPPDNTPNYQIFPVHVDDRPAFAQYMRERGIMVNVNNRRNDRYKIFGGLQNLPQLARADEDVILLPLHADLTDDDVARVVDGVLTYDRP